MKNFLRKLRAIITKTVYGNPSKNIKVIGVTGTDGKTTTSEMMYQILISSGFSSGLVSTIGAKINGKESDTGLHTSTPTSKQVYSILREMKNEKVEYAVFELTSHGLDQGRAYGVRLEACIFTNITQDHFDYHKTFENYRSAKSKIIDMVKDGGYVIINADDKSCDFLYNYAKNQNRNLNIVFYSLNEKSIKNDTKMYVAKDIRESEDGYTFDVKMPNLKFNVSLHTPGEYNIQNALGAIAASISMALPMSGIIKGIEGFRNVEGRMNIVQKDPYKVVIDFAHTPNGMESILKYFRNRYTNSRIIVMYGCAGHRDKSKREIIGKNTSIYADVLVITSEDPRDEKYEDIYKDIFKGIDKNKFNLNENLFSIESREEAIKYIFENIAKAGDILLFLGKGHEKSMAIGDKEYPWNEKEVVLKYLNKNV